jgi:hypothetical protein
LRKRRLRAVGYALAVILRAKKRPFLIGKAESVDASFVG